MEKVIAPVLCAPRRSGLSSSPPRDRAIGTLWSGWSVQPSAAPTSTSSQQGEIRLGLPGDVVRLPIILGHENVGVIERIGTRRRGGDGHRGRAARGGREGGHLGRHSLRECYYCRNYLRVPLVPEPQELRRRHKLQGPAPPLRRVRARRCSSCRGRSCSGSRSACPNEVAALTEQMAVAYGAFGRAFQNPNSKEGYSPADTVVVQGVGPLGHVQRSDGADARRIQDHRHRQVPLSG